ncbi:centrosomal protein of 104 kDa [Anabrus simplex]|uniref:centrosomal protein of 104 kDa n=1 Tax=Anabrus simplex TaxID=316456 RepID=UPI0035A3D0FE
MPHKIGFTVVYASGEDERHRASELNVHGPIVRGWQSAKGCSYPQELILQLHSPATIQRIQVLAHQYLIPEKLELWAGSQATDPAEPQGASSNTHFEYLGFITLSDNQSTGFKSRELKSVTVPSVAARYLKLRLHRNHPNALNVHNQVGLIAINVLGQTVEAPAAAAEPDQRHEEQNNNGRPATTSNGNNNALLLVNNPQYTSPYDDLAFEMYVDQEVARIIRTMEVKKQQAVIDERFEYARKLKLAMEDLRNAGERLSKYELEKRQAIHLEDYDRAKLKKAQMDEYRTTIYRFLEVDDLLEVNGPLAKNDECLDMTSRRPELPPPPRLLQVPPSVSPPSREGAVSPVQATPAMHQSPVSPLHYQNRPKSPPVVLPRQSALRSRPSEQVHFRDRAENRNQTNQEGSNCPHSNSKVTTCKGPKSSPTTSPTNVQQNPPALRSSLRRRNKSAGAATAPVRTSYEAYEERTVPALRHCHTSVLRDYQADTESTRSKLNEREKKQAALPISVFGLELVEKFYSKQYSDKEEGLRMLKDELRAQVCGERTDLQHPPNKIARAAIYLLHRALRDKVYAVYSLAAENIRVFFTEFVPTRVTPAEVARSVDRLLPELLSKSGDTTPRIHNMAVHTILSMADCQEVRELNLIPVHLSRPLTSSTHPRLALSRLEMVEQLVLNHGISTDKNSGLTCRTLSEFGASGLHHPAEAVRKVAERVLTLVYRVNPRLVRKQLPPDDDITRRNLLYRQLYHEFDLIDNQRKKEILEKNKQAARVVSMVNNTSSNSSNNSNIVNKSPGHQTGSSSSSASVITSPSDTSQQDTTDDKMCIFCLVRAESFTEEGLNVHYWRSCPMLTRCSHCKQVVEIALFSQHLLEECETRHLYKKCDRCTEAIMIDFYDEHITSRECTPAEPPTTANRCPYCHSNIPPWEEGWRQHLMGLPCPNHPRKKHIKHRSKSPSDKDQTTQAPKTPTHKPQ